MTSLHHHIPQSETRPLLFLACCLAANGTSSYRDARNICRLSTSLASASVIVVTDQHGGGGGGGDDFFQAERQLSNVEIHTCDSAQQFLASIRTSVATHSPTHDIIFTLSSHGYTASAENANARLEEVDGRDEYVMVRGQRVLDHYLRSALYSNMYDSCRSLCLIDTCHGGSMLDLPYYSTDGAGTVSSFKTIQAIVDGGGVSPSHSYCISACSDAELDGEDISDFGGWGGKLICQFLDYSSAKLRSGATNNSWWHIDPIDFYQHVSRIFMGAAQQKSHPVFSTTVADLTLK